MESAPSTKVHVVLVDPWDLVTENGSGPFVAAVIQSCQIESTNTTTLLLEFESPIKCDGGQWTYFVATPRHSNKRFEDLQMGKTIPCNLYGIAEEKAKSANPCDLSQWRGGAAAIGTLSPHK